MKRFFTLPTLIRFLAAWTLLASTLMFVAAALFMPPNSRAVIFMATGVAVIWIGVGGVGVWKMRERVRTFVQRLPLPVPVTFALFCTLLALAEEAVTVSMTNLAPLFGVPLGVAYITASANYLDVVLFHSVVVFVPMFIAWGWMLTRWAIPPNVAFLAFGFTGFLLEAAFAGMLNFVQMGFWVFVYGLMIYLPAYSFPAREDRRPLKGWHVPLLVLIPILCAIPVALVMSTVHPISIHFPPIAPDS
ncbi:MAG TPA: hypothetical protein PK530_16485 [Anaerolineales bacterium]|nr:hypothetical protein [Anaerolineales bacterium]